MTDTLAHLPWTQIGLVGGAFIVIYAWLQAFHRTGRATGTITKIVSRPGAEGHHTDVPLITFNAGGRRYSFIPSLVVRGDAKRTRVGRKVTVAYNPANPEDAEVATPARLYLPPVVASVIYGAFLCYVLIFARR